MAGRIFIFCFILTFVTHSQGLQFFIYITSDSVYCGRLQCSFEKSAADNNVFSIIGLAVYETTKPNVSKKLASLSVFRPDIVKRESDNNIVNVTGNISISHAELTLGLRNQSYCLTGSFLCEMEFMDVRNKPDVIRSTISPLTNGYCNNTEKENVKLRKQVVDLRKGNVKLQNKVAELENGNITLQNNAVELENCDITLQNKVVELENGNIELQNKIVELENGKIQLQNKVVELENGTITLQNKVVELENGNVKLQNKVAEFEKENVKLEKQVVELQNETVKRGQDVVKLEKEVDEITQQNVSRHQEIVNTSTDKFQIQTQDTCSKGVPDPISRKPFLLWGKVAALCDTETDGGGWIIIQRRTKGDVDFYRGWNDYKNGFGTPETDFWIGNEVIHNLTSKGYRELQVDLEYQGKQYVAHYSSFSVAAETSFYRLSVSGYSGTVKDSLAYHNGRSFSTFDIDDDNNGDNCAAFWHGAWWYNSCYNSNLNGLWGAHNASGLAWMGLVHPGSVSASEMKIRHV